MTDDLITLRTSEVIPGADYPMIRYHCQSVSLSKRFRLYESSACKKGHFVTLPDKVEQGMVNTRLYIVILFSFSKIIPIIR